MTSISNPDFRSTWFSSTVCSHTEVTRAVTWPDGIVEIFRKYVPPITVAPLGNQRIDTQLVEAVLEMMQPTAIVLIPKSGHYDWEAREIAMASGSTILTLKELYTFMHEADPRPCLDKNVAYNRGRLEQHSQVLECRLICESSLHLKRKGSLSDVVVAIEYEYEFTEEATVHAINRHPDADIILNANPNGTATTAAYAHARDAGVSIFKIGELMGALNYDGDRLRDYQPPRRR